MSKICLPIILIVGDIAEEQWRKNASKRREVRRKRMFSRGNWLDLGTRIARVCFPLFFINKIE